MAKNPTPDEVKAYAAQVAGQYGLPRSWFLAMIDAESGYDPSVGLGKRKSSAGAVGYAQLMPSTARGLGVDPYDWRQNIEGGARYFKSQFDRFHDPRLALSAYNSGPGGSESRGQVEQYTETKLYVAKVAALEKQYRNFGGAEPFSGKQLPESAQATDSPPDSQAPPNTPAPDLNYISTLERLGPLSSRVAQQAKLFQPLSAPSPTSPDTEAPSSTGPTTQPFLPAKNDGWMGSKNLANSLVAGSGLNVTSEKRTRRDTTSGNRSDHWSGSKDSYAYDLSNGSEPTPEMDQEAMNLVTKLGGKWDGKSPLVFSTIVNGYRVQVLYRTNVGGNHFNHIHVGVRRVGK